MRAPRMVVAIALTGVLSVATVLTGLITNEASAQQRWPGWLELVRTHPWHSLGVLALLLGGLTIVLTALPDARSKTNSAAGSEVPAGGPRPSRPSPTRSPPSRQTKGDDLDAGGNHSERQRELLKRLSTELVSRLGRRRTAYPLDLSLAELHRLDLLVASRLGPYQARAPEMTERAVTALATRLRHGGSVLLLGEPGSGKSLSLYGVALALREAGLLPIPLRALDAVEVAADLSELEPTVMTDAVMLVDGLDEASELAGGGPLANALVKLLRHAPALVTSRTREYEEWVAFETTAISFDEVFVLKGWSVEVEFADYLARLQRHGLIDDPHLFRTVVASERLARLVERPLYARMLTFIGPDAANRVGSASNLYGEYLIRLGRATDFAIRGSHPSWHGQALDVWQAAAWFIHSRELPADAIPVAELHTALVPEPPRGAEIRALAQVVDRRTLHGSEVGEFLHYSFYEYLLARHIRNHLLSLLSPEQTVVLLRRDLTREIRHHLIGQLQELADEGLGERLSGLYRRLRDEPGLDPADRLTVCNLLVYLISRVSPAAPKQLGALMHRERNEFLLNSILWALCHHRSDAALGRFFSLLRSDRVFRACSRGYVLYYYGDVRTGRPPFLDEPPYLPHERTSNRMLAIFESATFQAIPAQRRYVDLYTFMDIYLVRHEKIGGRALSILRAAVEALPRQGLTHEMEERLSGMLAAISVQPTPDTDSTSFG